MGISFRQSHKLPDKDTYFGMVTTRCTPGTVDKLRNAVVGIAGVGGLGSNIAVQLARSGIGKLIIADFDLVDPSNLNRQNYYVRHIGMPKTEALKEIIAQINPYIVVETHQVYLDQSNIVSIFEGVDVMVEAFDKAENKSLLLDVWLSQLDRTPLITASGMAGSGPSNHIQTRKLGKNIYLVGDLQTEASAEEGLLAPRVILAAAHQCHAVIRLLIGETEV